MTHAPLSILDWGLIGLVMTGVFVLVYAFTRRRRTIAVAGDVVAEVGVQTEQAHSTPPGKPASRVGSPQPTQPATELPRLDVAEEEEEVDPTKVGAGAAASGALRGVQSVAHKIVCDAEAAVDEETHGCALILVTGTAQTDKGVRRKRNEDAVLSMPEEGIFAVADGMGGYHGGDIASSLAVKAVENAFRMRKFDGPPHDDLPRRASELARAIQMANASILERVAADRRLAGMGTTVCAARFSSNKQRLYIGHVGDSRVYRLRDGRLTQLTADHTMGILGVGGAAAGHLSRAVGIWPTVPIDIILCKPRPRDVYLLCSDGLTKMVSDARIGQILHPDIPPVMVVEALIDAANANGGKDNVSTIVIRVDAAS